MPNDSPQPPAPAIARVISAAGGVALGIISAWLCWQAAGATLGLFLCSVMLAALIVPPLAVTERTPWAALRVAGAVVVGIGAVWLWVVLKPHLPDQPYPRPGDWLVCIAVLASFCLFLCGLAALLVRLRITPALASFLTVLLALAWLTWPVWLSSSLAGHDSLVVWLAAPHPLIALNSQMEQLGLWVQQPMAYHLTDLNHDVPLPISFGATWAIAAHTLLGLLLLGAARACGTATVPATGDAAAGHPVRQS